MAIHRPTFTDALRWVLGQVNEPRSKPDGGRTRERGSPTCLAVRREFASGFVLVAARPIEGHAAAAVSTEVAREGPPYRR